MAHVHFIHCGDPREIETPQGGHLFEMDQAGVADVCAVQVEVRYLLSGEVGQGLISELVTTEMKGAQLGQLLDMSEARAARGLFGTGQGLPGWSGSSGEPGRCR